MRGSAEDIWPIERHAAKEDRALCRSLIELLRPERERLDTAVAALDEYLLLTLDAEPEPTPKPAVTPTPEPSEPSNPFADL